jgi:hypothetical protein
MRFLDGETFVGLTHLNKHLRKVGDRAAAAAPAAQPATLAMLLPRCQWMAVPHGSLSPSLSLRLYDC